MWKEKGEGFDPDDWFGPIESDYKAARPPSRRRGSEERPAGRMVTSTGTVTSQWRSGATRMRRRRQAASGFVGNLGWDYHSLGRACLLLGQLDEARRLGARAIESSPRQPGYAAHALHLLGDIATHPDRFDAERGEVHYREALALAEPRGMRPLVAHCHLGLGALHGRAGRVADSKSHLALAEDMYRQMAMTFWLERASEARGVGRADC